jgi:hypothetical protein
MYYGIKDTEAACFVIFRYSLGITEYYTGHTATIGHGIICISQCLRIRIFKCVF